VTLGEELLVAIDRGEDLQTAIAAICSRFGVVERVRKLAEAGGENGSIGFLVDMQTPAQAVAAQGQLGVGIFGFSTLIISVELPRDA